MLIIYRKRSKFSAVHESMFKSRQQTYTFQIELKFESLTNTFIDIHLWENNVSNSCFSQTLLQGF